MSNVRIVVNIGLLVSAFFMPWWFTMALALCAALYFSSYYEIVVLGIILDSLYNASIPRFYHIQFVLTYGAIIVIVISIILRERLRFNR